MPQELFILGLAAVTLACFAALVLRRGKKRLHHKAAALRPQLRDALDTLMGWSPERSRVLSSAERQAYALLSRTLPDHIILAQVPLARFVRVPTRNSYAEWMRRVGQLCVDIVVCNHLAEVVAVIEVRGASDHQSERGKRREERMHRVLRAAGISLHIWRENRLPTAGEVRLAILGDDAASDPAPPYAGAQPGHARGQAAHAGQGLREPPTSTWFDDMDSSPMPLNAGVRAR